MKKIQKSFTFEGKRYYFKGDTEAEVYEKMTRRKVELEEGRKRITKNTLVKDWVSEWLDTYKIPTVSDTWARSVEGMCNSVIIPRIGTMQLKSVKPIHLQRILNDYADKSKSYLRIIDGLLNQIFRTAKENDLILDNPAERLSLPSGKKAVHRRSITPTERKHILSLCEKHRAGLFYKIMLYCGLRPAEVAALQWRNIDLKKRVLTVDSAMKQYSGIGAPKSEAGYRKVPIPEALVSSLEKEQKPNPFDFVCTNARGGKLTKDSMSQQWDSFKHDLNIEMGCRVFRNELIPPYPVADDLVPYCLRHTYCTDLQAAGVPINVARELMGHSSISITSKIYTHSSAESFQDAAAAINALEKRRAGTEKMPEKAAK